MTAAPKLRIVECMVCRTVFLKGKDLLPAMLYEENSPWPNVPLLANE